jgi:hypothetical protein
MTEASLFLHALARRCAELHLVHTAPRAVLLTGSAAQGESDGFSDLDLIMYYDELPSEEAIRAARDELNASKSRALFPRSEQAFGETCSIDGVECQVVYFRIAAWEAELRRALEEHDPDPILQKMLGGLLEGLPVTGEELIDGWKRRAAAYPEGLARAMIEKHLQFFPLWYLQERIGARDAALWQQQILLDGAQNILGVLAGLNRLYYSSFQFKRIRRFIAQMQNAPADLAGRLEQLFGANCADASRRMETLVSETISLVDRLMPGIDTSSVHAILGQRQPPWRG